jgi:hypothetical protein
MSDRILKVTLLAAVVLGLLALVGCASPTNAEKSDNPKVWGYVASADKAKLEVAENQLGADELVVKSVTAPEDGWLVVHLDNNGKPGARVGLTAIDKGESTNVRIKLKDVTTPKVIVAVHADRGKDNKFDFDMMAKEMSPDRPFFVNEKELASEVTVRGFGVKADDGTAAIVVSAQPGARQTLTIDRALAPTGAWVVVHADDGGAPGARVGLLQVPAGETVGAIVQLYPVPLTNDLFVAVHADRGEAGTFEFDMMNKINSPDQPFFVGGEEVATKVSIK